MINGIEYVLDQYTQDPKNSFAMQPSRTIACSGQANVNSKPFQSPEGLIFTIPAQQLRLANANNIQVTNRFLIAIWVKAIELDYPTTTRNEQLFAFQRYDNRNDSDPFLQIGVAYNAVTSKVGMKASMTLYSTGTSSYTYYSQTVSTNSEIKDGWVLLSLGVDNLSQASSTKLFYRVRTYANGKDNIVDTLTGYQVKMIAHDKTDVFIGAACDLNTNSLTRPFKGTVSRLYIWKSIGTIISSDSQFDKYFFRQNTGIPSCTTTFIPCKFCVVGFGVSILSMSMTLPCTSSSKSVNELYLAKWDFNNDNQEYIVDQSNNGFNLYKDPVNDIEATEIWRVYNQGYLFDYMQSIFAAYPIIFSNYPQWTIDAWIRKDFLGSVVAADNGGWPLILVRSNNNATKLLEIYVSDLDQNIYISLDNGVNWSWKSFAGLLQTSQWTYVALSTFSYVNSATWRMQIKYTVNTQTQTGAYATAPSFNIPQNAYMYFQSHRSIYVNRVRVYSTILTTDELPALVGTYNAIAAQNQCTKMGTQAQCQYCPIETKQCISACNQNQYGTNCANCHFACGHCTGSTRNDCVYCSRDPATSLIVYSNTYGNCTCTSNYYFDTLLNQCVQCHTNCQECYGPNQNQCLTCKATYVYYSPGICVSTCSDPLVVQGTTIGFYVDTETVSGVSFPVCAKCYPYCASCTGPLNGQCQSCQASYFLNGGNTCVDACGIGLYGDAITQSCQPCDGTCTTCTGPNSNNCITCADPTKVQQGGICQASCNNGFYKDSNSICQGCHTACATCTSPLSTTCGSCNTGYYLEWLGFSCKTSCPNGNYPDTATNMCLLCHYSCETCNGPAPSQCTKCAKGYLKRQNLCVTACSDGEFIVNGACATCDSKCSSCFGPQNDQCYSCSDNLITGLGYYYFNQSCITACPDGYYPDNFAKICKPCKSICATCTSWDFCTSCVYGPYQLNNGECTYFTCMTTQYRAIRPSLACYDCDPSCQTCQGGSQFDCMSCSPKYQLLEQQCLTCDEQPGMTEPIDGNAIGCVEICGDGFNYGQYECDDGNLVNGDGCSSKCQVESGFACSGGSILTPDSCVDIKNPTPSISLVNAKNSIYVSFDEEVTLQDVLDDNSLQISISGPMAPYKFEWTQSDDSKTAGPTQILIINMNMKSTLKGEEKVTLQFLNSKVYVDVAGNGIITLPLTAGLSAFEYIDPATKAKLDAAGDSSMMATFGGMAINLAISLVFGGSISAMWTMVNTIQLVSLLPLMNVNWPNIVILVFQKMLSAHGETTAIPNILYDNVLKREGSNLEIEEAINDRFSSYGWTVSNFVYLSGRKILIWAGIIITYPFVWYMKKKYSDKHKFCKLWITAEQKYRYTLLLRGVIMSYASMYLASTINIFKMNFGSLENVISIFFAIAFQIILVYLPIHIMNILQRNYEKINHPKFMASYSTIIKEVDLTRPIRYMYYPVFLIRRLIFVLLLVIFANSPVIQIALMCFTAVVMMIYIVVIRPQKDKIMVALTAAGEAVLLILHLISIVFLDDTLNEEKANQIGWIVIVFVGAYILINWVIVVTITIIGLKKSYRDWKQRKENAKKKEQEDYEYKKWKKRKQLDKRQVEDKEKAELLDKHNERINEINAQKEFQELGGTAMLDLNGVMNDYQNLPYFDNTTNFNASPDQRQLLHSQSMNLQLFGNINLNLPQAQLLMRDIYREPRPLSSQMKMPNQLPQINEPFPGDQQPNNENQNSSISFNYSNNNSDMLAMNALQIPQRPPSGTIQSPGLPPSARNADDNKPLIQQEEENHSLPDEQIKLDLHANDDDNGQPNFDLNIENQAHNEDEWH